MTKYRKKPVVIEARQLTAENAGELAMWIKANGGSAAMSRGGTIIIGTLEGNHHASQLDYVIQGIQGEFYPCKPDIFAETYDPVEDQA